MKVCLGGWKNSVAKDIKDILQKLIDGGDLSKKELDTLKKAIKDKSLPSCVQITIDCYENPTTTVKPTTTTT